MADRTIERRFDEARDPPTGTRRWTRHLWSWGIWLYGVPAAALLGGLLHLNGLGPFQSLTATLESEAELEQRIMELQSENEALKQQIEALQPGRFGVEKRAREQLGWSRPGEIVIHIPDKR